MDMNRAGCVSYPVKRTNFPTILSSEMDFSLLASDMQKFLNISRQSPCKKLNYKIFSDRNVNAGKTRPRNCAYLEDIDIHKCPLCPVTFNAKDLLAKHALRIHQKAVVVLLQDGSTEQHLKCCFCVHKVMHRHQKLLLLHLEKKHAVEFVSYFKQFYVPSGLADTSNKIEVSHGPLNVNNLLHGLKGISLSDPTTTKVDGNQHSGCFPIASEVGNQSSAPSALNPENFDGSLFPIDGGQNTLEVKKQGKQMLCNSYAKRKLVLDGSLDCQTMRVAVLKENIPPREPFSLTLARSGWKQAAGKPFACGRCKEAFSCNALLLDHVGGRHRGPLRLLQPLFTCGLCSASFYKNSFLVRHCYQHHTPK